MVLSGIAYPKINLCLYVGEKRPDGFHNLISIFQLVRDSDYFDEISISILHDGCSEIVVSGLDFIADKVENTIFKASSLFIQNAGLTDSLSIRVNKKIPCLAGLGGGSADAACVLKLLNGFYGKYSDSDLSSLALQIGSDVPFFLCNSDTAVVEGRGDIITPISSRSDLSFIIESGSEEKKGTGFAYSELDKRPSVPSLPSRFDLVSMFFSPVSQWNFTNDFEFLYSLMPGLHLTGSGSWFFRVQEHN